MGLFFISWAWREVVFDHLLYQVSPIADERIISILRHQNLLKELQEIAAQGTVSLHLFGKRGFICCSPLHSFVVWGFLYFTLI